MLITKKIAVIALSIYSLLLLSCTENENEVVLQEEGKVEFSFNTISKNNLRTQKNSVSYLLISIVDSKDRDILNRQKIRLYSFGENFISEPIPLNTGRYFLTEFLILDDEERVIYATPKKEAKLDYLVEDALPIEFYIAKDHTEKVAPQVVPASEINPIDFGYTTFAFNVVSTFDFLLSVFVYDTLSSNFQLTDSRLQIKCNENVLFDRIIADSTNLIKIADGYSSYQLILSKEGYTTYQGEFSTSELKDYGNEPLIIKLFSGVSVDSGLLAFYPLNNNANDAGKYHYDGSIYEALPASDRYENTSGAYYFDGVNDKIIIGDVLDFPSNDFTISLWVKVDDFKGKIPNTNSYGSWIVSKGITIFGTPKRAGYAINAYKSIEGKNYFQFFLGDQQEQIYMIEKDGFSQNEWYHLVAMKQGLKQKLYINSELVAEADLPNTFSISTNIPLG